MSLNFDFTRIENYKEKCWKGDEVDPLCEALIWATLMTDIGFLTEEVAEEFLTRMKIAYGTPVLHRRDEETGEMKPSWPTLEEIKSFAGLKTNVPTLSRREWIQKRLRVEKEKMLRRFSEEDPLESARVDTQSLYR